MPSSFCFFLFGEAECRPGKKNGGANSIMLYRASFLATTILASLHVMRTRPGSGQQTHVGWIGKQDSVQI